MGFGLALVVQLTFFTPLAAQPVSLLGTTGASGQASSGLILRRPMMPSVLLGTEAVLASQSHLTMAGPLTLTTSAADRQFLGYVPSSPAASTPNVDPFVSTSLAVLHAPKGAAKSLTTSTTLSNPTVWAPEASHATSTLARARWRTRFHIIPTIGGTPNLPVPSGGGTTTAGNGGVDIGNVTGGFGSGIPAMGVPEPSTWLLCGMLLLIGGYWRLRRRGQAIVAAAEAPAQV